MEAILREFIQVMDQQNQILDQMFDLGEQKQHVIIVGQLTDLDSLIQEEAGLVANLENLENQRFKLQQQLGVQESTALELLEWAGQECLPLQGELEEAINRLGYNLTRLKAINNHNNELIEQSLQYIENVQAMLNGDIAGTYSDKGNPVDEKSGRQINLLDTRA
jgi:flagellar biosynthesis/type III secretory pathway chaperone